MLTSRYQIRYQIGLFRGNKALKKSAETLLLKIARFGFASHRQGIRTAPRNKHHRSKSNRKPRFSI